jgi:murein DD-endopeptidase MepM/ murein hydrolase activator NlpD
VNFKQGRPFGVAPERRIADSASAARAIPTGKGGATMTAFWVRTALLGASAMTLQACDLPHSQYAPYEGYQTPTSRPMAQPQYPVTTDQPSPMRSTDPHDPVAKPSGDVTSQPLPPPGPSSAIRSMFINASYDGTAPALLTEVAYRHRRGHAMHVSARGRLERSDSPNVVKLKKGDTIESLAEQYGTTKQAILKANRIRHPRDLAVGATLNIPAGASASADAAAGDSMAGTARPTRAEAMAEARQARAGSKPYVTHNGDTLYSLGRRYHVSPKVLADLNGLPPDFHLHIGQHIRLPGEGETAAEAEGEAPTPPRAVATARGRARVRGTFAPPLAPNDTAIAGTPMPPVAQPTPPVRPTRLSRNDIGPAGPAAPVPYTSLPGHLTAPVGSAFVPPQRPTGPAYIPPVNLPQAAPTPPDAQVVLAGRGRFVWPVHGPLLSSFGPKPGGQRSDGLDISAPTGSAVHAAATGDVVYAGDLVPGLGNLVLIKHDDGWITAYAHLSRTEVKIKDHVLQGAEIGLTGQTGGAAQPEVYFEIRYAPTPRDKAKPVDPSLLLSSQ